MRIIRPNIVFRNALVTLQKSDVKYIVIHHAESKNASWEDIHRWHRSRGWAGAGYHEYIRKNGEVFILRGRYRGVHAKGYNRISYGICLEGDYNKEKTVPPQQMEALLQRIEDNMMRFRDAKVVFHRELCDTDCPGKLFPALKR